MMFYVVPVARLGNKFSKHKTRPYLFSTRIAHIVKFHGQSNVLVNKYDGGCVCNMFAIRVVLGIANMNWWSL